ncbi:MAG: acyloxyacyl hydrolase [Candidatus Methylomirabilales bacterium]
MGNAGNSGRLLGAAVGVIGFLAFVGPVGADPDGQGRGGPAQETIGAGPLPVVAAATAEPARAGTSEPRGGSGRGFRKGQVEFGVAAGYGFGIGFLGSENSGELEDIEVVHLRPHWGVFLTDPVGSGILRGNLEVVAELGFLLSLEGKRQTAYELAGLVRYHLATGGRWVPFVTGGLGLIETNFEFEGQAEGFNFTVQGGAGVSYFVNPTTALSAEWRLHHLSNLGTNEPNQGINTSLFLVGMSFFF